MKRISFIALFCLILLGVVPLSAQESRVKESPVIKGIADKVLHVCCFGGEIQV